MGRPIQEPQGTPVWEELSRALAHISASQHSPSELCLQPKPHLPVVQVCRLWSYCPKGRGWGR